MKRTKNRKTKAAKGDFKLNLNLTKGFYLWCALGLALYLIFTCGFLLLTKDNQTRFDIADLKIRGAELTGNDISVSKKGGYIYFNKRAGFDYNYMDISVSSLPYSTINVFIYGSNENKEDSYRYITEAYLSSGFNEIRIAPYSYYSVQLAPTDEFSLDRLTLRSSVSPVYGIPQGLIFFAAFWLLLYGACRFFGIRYKGLRESLITVLEGLFAAFIIIIMLFALDFAANRLILLALIPLAAAALAIGYGRHSLSCFANAEKRTVIFVFAFVAVLMFVVGRAMYTKPATDLGTVFESAWQVINYGRVSTEFEGFEWHSPFMDASNNDYFVRYNANLPILAVLTFFYKIIHIFGFNSWNPGSIYFSIILNVAAIMAAIGFGMLAAKNLFGKKGALVYLAIAGLFVPYYIHASRFYTDTLSLPFTSLFLWLYSADDKKFKSPYIKYALMGLAIGAGALIKGSLMIIPVALAMQLAIKSVKNIRFAAVTVGAMVILSGVWGVYINNCSYIDLSQRDRLEFPLTHWVMMGLDREVNGEYSQEDFEYTDSFNTKAEKQTANVEKIKDRLGSFANLSDFAEYEFGRAADTWCDGQYMQSAHLTWGRDKSKGIYKFVLQDREYYSLFNVYTVIYSFALYILAAAGGILSLKRPKADYAMFLRLTMLGAIFFFMLWESKSRYILNLTPVFMLAAIYGLEEIKKLIDKERDLG